jgi:Amt family ammonium transporter
VGILAVGVFVVIASGIAWGILEAVIGIRVAADEERAGLDIGEHGISAYPEFHAALDDTIRIRTGEHGGAALSPPRQTRGDFR